MQLHGVILIDLRLLENQALEEANRGNVEADSSPPNKDHDRVHLFGVRYLFD